VLNYATLPDERTFSEMGLSNLRVGSRVSEEVVSKAFPTLNVTRDHVMAEGDVVGTMFVVSKGDKPIAAVYSDDSGKVSSIKFFEWYRGPGGLEPQVSTYEEAQEILQIKSCFGGIEDSAEEIHCETAEPGVTVGFKGDLDYSERELSERERAKLLPTKHVQWISVAESGTVRL
jgi:hypothetical protein